MDACLQPAPQEHPGTEEDTFYRAGLRRVTEITINLAEDIGDDHKVALPEKAKALDCIARVIRRNGLTARYLRQPPRPAAPPSPSPRRAPAGPPDTGRYPPDLSKLTDAELATLEREQIEREQLDPIEVAEMREHFKKLPILELLAMARPGYRPNPSAGPTQPGSAPGQPPASAPAATPPQPAPTRCRHPDASNPSPDAPPAPPHRPGTPNTS